jgi:hypothetical protein
MNIPEFTADTSLYRTSNSYRSSRLQHRADNRVHLASCFSDCVSGCTPSCSGLFGQARVACVRECRSDCLDACSAPPPPVCGPCVGVRQCSNGTQQSCAV